MNIEDDLQEEFDVHETYFNSMQKDLDGWKIDIKDVQRMILLLYTLRNLTSIITQRSRFFLSQEVIEPWVHCHLIRKNMLCHRFLAQRRACCR
jgi:hypothetical protein